jgi:hypothetical protein
MQAILFAHHTDEVASVFGKLVKDYFKLQSQGFHHTYLY